MVRLGSALTYKTPAGTVADELLYSHDETRLKVVVQRRLWGFDGDGAQFRLPRQPLRFLLADDPGARKTIMANGV